MAYVYIGGDLAHSSGPNGVVTRVVMHATVSGCHAGGAREVARYFQSPNAGGLAHFVVDPTEVVQCAPEDLATWHAPPNRGSLGVELCDWQAGDPMRWRDADHEAMLHLAARLVADLCKRHAVPLVALSARDLLAGHHGITTHHAVTDAWHRSTHTDPDQAGPFPLAHFLALVGGVLPTPPSPPPPHPSGVPAWYRRKLSIGMQGADVRHAQLGAGLRGADVDGAFGPHTKAAVVAFQKHRQLTPTGVVDATTAKAMG